MSEHGRPAIVSQYASIALPRIICRFDEVHLSTGQCDCACAEMVNKSPNCAIYRALYPEVIRLEGLRLLKYADDP